MQIDYENLLIEYMATVIACEGLSYVRDAVDGLTSEESNALLVIETAANERL